MLTGLNCIMYQSLNQSPYVRGGRCRRSALIGQSGDRKRKSSLCCCFGQNLQRHSITPPPPKDRAEPKQFSHLPELVTCSPLTMDWVNPGAGDSLPSLITGCPNPAARTRTPGRCPAVSGTTLWTPAAALGRWDQVQDAINLPWNLGDGVTQSILDDF